MVLLRPQNYNEGTPGVAVPLGEKRGHLGNSYPQNLNHSETFLDLDQESRDNLAMLSPCKCLLCSLLIAIYIILSYIAQYGGEMSELDDAGTYYDLGPKKVTQRGTYYYMCSRNNNFTNRSQKGKIIIVTNSMSSKRIGWNGGSVEVGR